MKKFLGVFFLLATANANTYSVNAYNPQQHAYTSTFTGGDDQTIAIPLTFYPFDTSLGTLDSVEIVTNFTPIWSYRGEKLSDVPSGDITWLQSVELQLTYNNFDGCCEYNLRNIVGNWHGSSYTHPGFHTAVSAYDGITDFAGTSGFIAGGTDYTYIIDTIANKPRERAWWSRQTLRTIYLCPRFLYNSDNGWGGGWTSQFQADMNFAQNVYAIYTYH